MTRQHDRTMRIIPVLHRPQKEKKTKAADSSDEPTTGTTSTSVFCTYDVSYFRQNSSLTSNEQVNHPVMDSSVLSLHMCVEKRQRIRVF